jgi:hypothetical protein
MGHIGYDRIELQGRNLGCGGYEIMLRWQFGVGRNERGGHLLVGAMWIRMMRSILSMERIITDVLVIKVSHFMLWL